MTTGNILKQILGLGQLTFDEVNNNLMGVGEGKQGWDMNNLWHTVLSQLRISVVVPWDEVKVKEK